MITPYKYNIHKNISGYTLWRSCSLLTLVPASGTNLFVHKEEWCNRKLRYVLPAAAGPRAFYMLWLKQRSSNNPLPWQLDRLSACIFFPSHQNHVDAKDASSSFFNSFWFFWLGKANSNWIKKSERKKWRYHQAHYALGPSFGYLESKHVHLDFLKTSILFHTLLNFYKPTFCTKSVTK